VDSATGLRPRTGLGGASVQLRDARANVGRPGCLSIRIDLDVEALDEFAGQCRPFFRRQSKRLCQQRLGVHGLIMTHAAVRLLAPPAGAHHRDCPRKNLGVAGVF
jgi:hypothetical protein